MTDRQLMKKLYGTTSLSKVSLDDVKNQIGNLAVLRKTKEITKEQYKTYSKFNSRLLDDVLEMKEEQKLKKLSENSAAGKKDNRVQAYLNKMFKKAKKELLNIQVDDVDEKKKYHVSFIGKVKWETPDGDLFRTIYASEDIRASVSSSEETKVYRAFDSYLKKSFEATSPPVLVSWKNVNVVDFDKRSELIQVGMGRLNMEYVAFTDLPETFKSADDKCVIDYLMYESASSGRKRWTRNYLYSKLGDMPNTQDILDFAKDEDDISVYALDMFMNVFAKHKAEKSQLALFFVCNNKHCYPILDKSLRKSIAIKHCVQFEDFKLQFKDFDDDVAVVDAEADIVSMDAKHVIVESDNLKDVAVAVMKDTNKAITSWKMFNNKVVGFKHPVKNQVVSAGEDYESRKMVCDAEFAKSNNNVEFKFVNQSFGMIALAMFENKYGVLPTSEYSPDMKLILEKNPTLPYRMCNDKEAKNVKSVDIHKCYSNIVMNNTFDYPVHTGFDVTEPFNGAIVPGQYYISKTVYAGVDKSIKVSRGWYQYELVSYLLDIKVLKMSDITHQLVARSVLSASTFKAFVEYVYATYSSTIAKLMLNLMIGCFGALHYKNEQVGITTDWDTCVSTLNQYGDKKMKFNEIDNLYVIQMIEEKMKNSGHMTIYRSVIGQSIIELDKMSRAVFIPGKTRIIGYNTDAIKMCGKFNKSMFSNSIGGFELEKCKALMGYSMDELDEFPEYEYKPMVVNVEYDTPMSERSELRLGAPGCGKSYGLSKWYRDGDVVLCYTNACCEQLKRYGVEAHTFESYTIDPSTGKPNMKAFAGAKRVALDEYKTLPPSLMNLLLNAKAEFGFQLVCLGDYNQTKAPCDNWIEYHTNRRFLEALGNVVYMSYNPATGRYDKKLDNTLRAFVASGVLEMPCGNKIQCDYNICYSNIMRHKLNQTCLARWVNKHNTELVEIGVKSDKWKTRIRVAVGLEMMVYDDNDLINKLYKTHRYIVKEIKEKSIVVYNAENTAELSFENFVKIFDYSYAYTIYKIQGITMDKPFNVFEAERMSFNELYTSVSRAKRYDDVHIDGLKLVRYMSDEVETARYSLKKAKLTVGRIYLIKFNNGTAYVGQTTLDIYKRFGQHLEKATNHAMNDALANNSPTIELLEEITYSDKRSLNALEESYMDIFKGCFTLLNAQHNTKPVMKESVVMAEPKFKRVKEDPAKKRYTINYTKDGKYLKKYFSYALCGKDMAMRDAEAWVKNNT